MIQHDWGNEDDEYIADVVTLAKLVMKKVRKNEKLTEKEKQKVIDDCLDKLNLLYNEQRKRGTFRADYE